MISLIIPSRQERWLDKTIEEARTKFKGEYEIIVTLDGGQKSELPEGVRYIKNEEPKGMRTAINQAVAVAEGDYLMKLDAHCMLDEGIDLKLLKEHKPKWVQIPRRKRLDAHKWELIQGRTDIDYMYIGNNFIGMKDGGKNTNPELKKVLIDDTETFQGSCYFIRKDYFLRLGLLDDKNFAGSGNEAQEITLSVLHDGGRVIRNKKTWYAHARTSRYYSTDRSKSRLAIRDLAKKYGYKKD